MQARVGTLHADGVAKLALKDTQQRDAPLSIALARTPQVTLKMALRHELRNNVLLQARGMPIGEMFDGAEDFDQGARLSWWS